MYTNETVIDNQTEVLDLNQIHGGKPYEFARHYEGETPVSNGTTPYTRHTTVTPYKRIVKSETKASASIFEAERENEVINTTSFGLLAMLEDETDEVLQVEKIPARMVKEIEAETEVKEEPVTFDQPELVEVDEDEE